MVAFVAEVHKARWSQPRVRSSSVPGVARLVQPAQKGADRTPNECRHSLLLQKEDPSRHRCAWSRRRIEPALRNTFLEDWAPAVREVRSLPGRTAVPREGSERTFPGELMARFADCRRASLVGGGAGEQAADRFGDRVGILKANHPSGALRLDPAGELITLGRDDRKAGPDVVEDPGAKAELRLQVVEVHADADLGL